MIKKLIFNFLTMLSFFLLAASTMSSAGNDQTQDIFFKKPAGDKNKWHVSRSQYNDMIKTKYAFLDPNTGAPISGMFITVFYPYNENLKSPDDELNVIIKGQSCTTENVHVLSRGASFLVYEIHPACSTPTEIAPSSQFIYGKIMRGRDGLHEITYGADRKMIPAKQIEQSRQSVRNATLK